MKAKIYKFTIIPSCIFIDNDEVIDEKQMKPTINYPGNDLDLKKLAKELESKVNEQILNKIKTATDK